MLGNLNSILKRIVPIIEQKSSSSALGVDIGTSSIKVVQIRKDKGVVVLETYGEISLGPYGGREIGQASTVQPEQMSEALSDLLREAQVSTKVCGASVPFASSLVRLIDLPPVTGNKLENMIPIEARKYIPVPISEVQLDWFVIPRAGLRFLEQQNAESHESNAYNDKTSVLLVAIHNEILRKYTDVFKIGSISPTFYEIEVFSVIRAIVERSMAPVAVIDIGASTTKIYIAELGIVVSSHVINKGGQHVTSALSNVTHTTFAKAEEMKRSLSLGGDSGQQSISHAASLVMEYILIESRRVFLAYQQKQNRVISKVVLTGGGSMIGGLRDFAYQQLEIPVEIADPFSHVSVPAILVDTLKATGPSFSGAVGLALRIIKDLD